MAKMGWIQIPIEFWTRVPIRPGRDPLSEEMWMDREEFAAALRPLIEDSGFLQHLAGFLEDRGFRLGRVELSFGGERPNPGGSDFPPLSKEEAEEVARQSIALYKHNIDVEILAPVGTRWNEIEKALSTYVNTEGFANILGGWIRERLGPAYELQAVNAYVSPFHEGDVVQTTKGMMRPSGDLGPRLRGREMRSSKHR